MHRFRPQDPSPPVGDYIDAPDETIANEEREHVVPVPTLRGGDVDLERVTEAEEAFGLDPVPDHVVERAQQYLGGHSPPAGTEGRGIRETHVIANANPDEHSRIDQIVDGTANRARPASASEVVVDPTLGDTTTGTRRPLDAPTEHPVPILDRREMSGRVEPLGEVIHPREAATLAHGESSAREQRLQDPLRRRPLPPSWTPGPTEYRSVGRAFDLDATEDLASEPSILGEHRTPPAVLGLRHHAGPKPGEVVGDDQARLMRPDLGDSSRPTEAVERSRGNPADARRESQTMGTGDRADGVDLHTSQARDGIAHVLFRGNAITRCESLPGDHYPPRLDRRELVHS